MIAALLIALREGLEAALIVGIVLSYLRKTGQGAKNRYAWAGVIVAIVLSVVLAIVITVVGAELEGNAEHIFEGITLLLAVGVLTWMLFWMRYQARTMKSTIERSIDEAISGGQNRGLFAVTFLAVFREGIETALFLSAAAFASTEKDTLVGALIGLALAALIGYLIYGATVRLNIRVFFNVTSVLLLIFAAGLLSHGIHEFQEAGMLGVFNAPVWNTNAVLDEESPLGLLAEALFGYSGAPSLLQVIAYPAYWLLALLGVPWLVNRRIQEQNAAVSQTIAKA